jgi:hypothetical protein
LHGPPPVLQSTAYRGVLVHIFRIGHLMSILPPPRSGNTSKKVLTFVFYQYSSSQSSATYGCNRTNSTGPPSPMLIWTKLLRLLPTSFWIIRRLTQYRSQRKRWRMAARRVHPSTAHTPQPPNIEFDHKNAIALEN